MLHCFVCAIAVWAGGRVIPDIPVVIGWTACRMQKIGKMCNVMGTEFVYDPDPTYELTADNVKKMLAIYMRFRYVWLKV